MDLSWMTQPDQPVVGGSEVSPGMALEEAWVSASDGHTLKTPDPARSIVTGSVGTVFLQLEYTV